MTACWAFGQRDIVLGLPDPLTAGHFDWGVFGIIAIKVVVAFVLLLLSVLIYIWGMRKWIADMQNRVGPERAGPFGVLQTLADGIKLFFKEQAVPETADRPVFRIAPYLSIMPAFLMFCVVPIGGVVSMFGHEHASAGGRPAVRRAVDPRHVGHRRLRRDARGLVERLEVPAARLGARVGTDAVVRGRVRARHPRHADPHAARCRSARSSTSRRGRDRARCGGTGTCSPRC